PSDLRRRQPEAVDDRRGDALARGAGDIGGIGVEDLGRPLDQEIGGDVQGPVLGLGRQRRQRARRRLRPSPEISHTHAGKRIANYLDAMTEVKNGGTADLDSIASALVSAFHDDPVMLHLFNKPASRDKRMRSLFLSESK